MVHVGNLRLRPWNMTLSSYTVLRVVANRPNLSLVQLARRCFVTPPTMTRVVSGSNSAATSSGSPTQTANAPLVAAHHRRRDRAHRMDLAVNQLGPTINAVLDEREIAQLDAMLRRCAQATEAEISQL